jgi:sugar phosphate permease
MGDVGPTEAGLASGVVNTAFMFGGALGLAVLVSLAASRTDTLVESGDSRLVALTGGYHAAFLAAAAFAVAAAVVGAALLRAGHPAAAHGGEEAMGAPAAAEAD